MFHCSPNNDIRNKEDKNNLNPNKIFHENISQDFLNLLGVSEKEKTKYNNIKSNNAQ